MADSNVVSSGLLPTKKKLGTAELLFRRAAAMGLQPDWVTPGGLFAVRVGGREQYINFARSPLNSHTGASLAKNKYLTRRILERNGMENIPFILPATYADAQQFLEKHGKIIAKPISGSGAHDINVITAAHQLLSLDIRKYILEKYISGKELRYLVLNDSVIGVHLSEYGTSVAKDRPLRRISCATNEWEAKLVQLALHTAHVLGLRFAAVDFLIESSGAAYILEVNTAPGLKWFHAPTSGPVVDVAGQFLKATLNTIGGTATNLPQRPRRCASCMTYITYGDMEATII